MLRSVGQPAAATARKPPRRRARCRAVPAAARGASGTAQPQQRLKNGSSDRQDREDRVFGNWFALPLQPGRFRRTVRTEVCRTLCDSPCASPRL